MQKAEVVTDISVLEDGCMSSSYNLIGIQSEGADSLLAKPPRMIRYTCTLPCLQLTPHALAFPGSSSTRTNPMAK